MKHRNKLYKVGLDLTLLWTQLFSYEHNRHPLWTCLNDGLYNTEQEWGRYKQVLQEE